MLGLKLNLSGIYSFFRVPYNSLLMDTYFFPPKTTAIGMLGAAVGWEEEEFLENIEKLQYGLIIEKAGEKISETAVIYKNERAPVYPMIKNMIYKPQYKVFFTSTDDKVIKTAYDCLSNPKYVISMGDSENLLYPKFPKFVEIFDNVTNISVDKLACLLQSNIYKEYVKGFSMRDKCIISPQEVKIPVNFEGDGKNRRSILENVYFYSGIELNLKKPLMVSEFGDDRIYLF